MYACYKRSTDVLYMLEKGAVYVYKESHFSVHTLKIEGMVITTVIIIKTWNWHNK